MIPSNNTSSSGYVRATEKPHQSNYGGTQMPRLNNGLIHRQALLQCLIISKASPNTKSLPSKRARCKPMRLVPTYDACKRLTVRPSASLIVVSSVEDGRPSVTRVSRQIEARSFSFFFIFFVFSLSLPCFHSPSLIACCTRCSPCLPSMFPW